MTAKKITAPTGPGPASMAMLQALAELDDANRRTPCQDPDTADWWTSDDAREREGAATRCAPCPLLEPCAAAADERREVWHVGRRGQVSQEEEHPHHPKEDRMNHTPPQPWLANVPDHVLDPRRTGVLVRWLEARQLRPSLADVAAERERRGMTGRPTT